uniref:Uncharacterized protein n=1 Tax=Anguilla anguilla TaxID=7936 RepID=A0A0E9RBF0_ANGAN
MSVQTCWKGEPVHTTLQQNLNQNRHIVLAPGPYESPGHHICPATHH